MAERGRSYAWALRFRARGPAIRYLSREAREGFDYAFLLAENAHERAELALAHSPQIEKLTLTQLARDDSVSLATVRKRLEQVRRELFGKNLGDRAIRYQLANRQGAAPRVCAEPGCDQPLPAHASERRRYCDDHRTVTARQRRQRRKRNDR
jgi:hypothetical protein